MTESEFKDMEGRLENWRIALSCGLKVAYCGSAERGYRPPRVKGEDERDMRVVMDMHDAWLIESAWRTLMPQRVKWLIKWHYVQRAPKHGIMRQLIKKCGYGIRADRYNYEVFHAVSLLLKSIDRICERDYSSQQQFDSTSFGAYGSQAATLSRPEKAEPAAA